MKRFFSKLLAGTLALTLCITTVNTISISASSQRATEEKETITKVENIKQTSATYTSVSISWDAFNPTGNSSVITPADDATAEEISEPTTGYYYTIQYVKKSDIEENISGAAISSEPEITTEMWNSNTAIHTYDNYTTIYGLESGQDYYLRIYAQTKTIPRTLATNSFERITVSTIPSKANVPSVTDLSATTATITWDSVKNANKYQVVGYKTGDSEKINFGTTTGTSHTLTKLSAGTSYNVIVYAINDNGKFEAVNDSEYNSIQIMTLPERINNINIKDDYSGRKAQIVSWDPATVEGYEIEVLDASNNVVTIYDVETTLCDVEKFVEGTWQSARARGYIIVNGAKKYSGYSDSVYFTKQTNVSKVKQVKKKKKWKAQAKITWAKVKGSTSYSVYISKKPTSKYTKIATTTKRSYTLKKYKGSSLKAGKAYYVRVVANKKVGNKKYSSFIVNKYKKFTLKR